MFCPKCSAENPNNGKFCRDCGADVSNVLAVVDGNFAEQQEITSTNNSAELKSTGVRNLLLGMGFVAIGVFLFTMPGNTLFWLLAMLPGFYLFASGVSRIMQADAAKTKKLKIIKPAEKLKLPEAETNIRIPSASEDYIKPQSSPYRTDDLVPLSVVEDTTRHLEMNSEGKTMTLPKKD